MHSSDTYIYFFAISIHWREAEKVRWFGAAFPIVAFWKASESCVPTFHPALLQPFFYKVLHVRIVGSKELTCCKIYDRISKQESFNHARKRMEAVAMRIETHKEYFAKS